MSNEEMVWRRALDVRISAFDRAMAIGPRDFERYMKALDTYDRALRLFQRSFDRYTGASR